jgi:hypothetical protein
LRGYTLASKKKRKEKTPTLINGLKPPATAQQYKLQGPAKKRKQNLALPRQLTIPALSDSETRVPAHEHFVVR